MKNSRYLLIFFWFLPFSCLFAQDDLASKITKTVMEKPAVSFSLMGLNPASSCYLPATNVFDLDESNEKLFSEKMEALMRGLGFWVAQSEALKEIGRQHPDLFKKCIHARDAFNQKFSPAILQVAYTLEKSSNGKLLFKDLYTTVLEGMKAIAQKDPDQQALYPWLFGLEISRSEAENFIETVRSRASFDSDFETLKPLLLFHPSAINNTMGMASADFLARYDFDDHPKAKGLSGWLRFPIHWESKEGNGPNIVIKFVSPRDGAMFFCQVQELSAEIPEGEDLQPLLDDENAMLDFAGQGQIMSKRIVQIAGQGAVELLVATVADTPLIKLYQQQLIYLVFYKKWLIRFCGGVGTTNETDCHVAMQSNLNMFKYLASMVGIKR